MKIEKVRGKAKSNLGFCFNPIVTSSGKDFINVENKELCLHDISNKLIVTLTVKEINDLYDFVQSNMTSEGIRAVRMEKMRDSL